jgi:hypothetical protein
MNEIEKTLIFGAVAVVAYFLKDLHSRFKGVSLKNEINHDEILILKSDVKQLEDKQGVGIEQIKEVFNMKFDMLSERMVEMQKGINHTDKTLQANNQLFLKIIEELKKK